jgi:hypothetical protein
VTRRARYLPQLWDQPRPAPALPSRPRRHAETSLDAYDALGDGRASKTARILAAIRAAGVPGLTRQELAAKLQPKVEINAVCGCVDHLLHDVKLIFEPLIGAVLPARRPTKKSVYLLREGRKILVAEEFIDHYPETKRERERVA